MEVLGDRCLRRLLLPILAMAAAVAGCSKPAEHPQSRAGYAYENVDDPAAEIDRREAKLSTSCAGVHCASPRVCRLLSTRDHDGVAHAYCLGPTDDLCRIDPELCSDQICRTQPGVCN